MLAEEVFAEVGAATTPDGNSIHWNPSKLAFIDKTFGVHLSYNALVTCFGSGY